jgi:hypothetical protein
MPEVAKNEGQVPRRFYALLHMLLRKDLSHTPGLLLLRTFSLQLSVFLRWAMLGSNQRPLPCEGRAIVC